MFRSLIKDTGKCNIIVYFMLLFCKTFYILIVNTFSNLFGFYIDVGVFYLNDIYIFMVFICIYIYFFILIFFISCIRATVRDNTKNIELQTETMLQEDLDTQMAKYTPTVNV